MQSIPVQILVNKHKPMLTKRNYFKTNNGYLSTSKIKDFIKDKHFFQQKHLLGLIKQEKTDPLILGSAVDVWLTQGEKKFRDKYYIVTRRNKKADDYEFQLNNSMLEQIEPICRAVERQTAFKSLPKSKAQIILTQDVKIGKHFIGICGMLDWLTFENEGKTAIITDLKTTDNAQPNKYHFKCLEYGYYLQMAMYDILVRYNFKDVEKIIHRHLVVEKDRDKIYKCYAYELNEDRVNQFKVFLADTIDKIEAEKYFKPSDCSWDKAVMIGDLSEKF